MELGTVNNFDALVDQALAEFAASQGGITTPDKKADYVDYAGFLQEISDEDQELAKSEITVASEIEENKLDDETNELLNDIKDNPNGWFNKSTWVANEKGEFIRRSDGEIFTIGGEDLVSVAEEPIVDNAEQELTEFERKRIRAEKLARGADKWKHNRDLRKIEINRMAFDQKILPLNDKLTQEDKRLVIELLTKPLRLLMIKYRDYIDNRVTKLLAPAIPPAVKLAAAKWPWIFIQNPGFLYKTHPHFGEVKTFWVNPKVPYFFKQGTEQAILEERDASLSPYFLDCLDRAIHRWYTARDNLAKREVFYATKMINIKGNTYYHLLMLNPFWFEKLYEHVKQQSLNDLN